MIGCEFPWAPSMQNENYIPVASEPDTFVRGHLVPVNLLNDVRRGWKAGIAYLILKIVAAILIFPEELSSVSFTVVATCEIMAVGAAVYGVYRWNYMSAWLLFLILIISAIVGALHPPMAPSPGGATIRIAFLIGFGVVFGRAALAIRAFNRNSQKTSNGDD